MMHQSKTYIARFAMLLIIAGLSFPLIAQEDESEFGAAVVIIELTDNDIELQVFVDGFDYTRVQGFDSNEKRFLDMKAHGRLVAQNGFSEVFFASEPSHYLEDEPDFDESIEEFLARWPEGIYEFEGMGPGGVRLEGETLFTHTLPDLPVILAPLPDADDEPPVFGQDELLVIDRDPVATCFESVVCDIEIFEYQVILDLAEPERAIPWVDGGTRRALINLPPEVTEVTVPTEYLQEGAYEFEILAIEISGNSTISVGEFEIED